MVNTEIEGEVEMGPHVDNAETPQNEKYDMSTTRAASRKEGQFFNQICMRKLNWVRNLSTILEFLVRHLSGVGVATQFTN